MNPERRNICFAIRISKFRGTFPLCLLRWWNHIKNLGWLSMGNLFFLFLLFLCLNADGFAIRKFGKMSCGYNGPSGLRHDDILPRLCIVVVGGISCQGFARVPVAMNQWDITSTESSCGVAAQKRRKFQQRGRWNAPQSEARREPARSAPEGPARGCATPIRPKLCVRRMSSAFKSF